MAVHSYVGKDFGSFEIRRILVPVDGSPNSIRALEAAIKIAKNFNAELLVLNVVPIPALTMEATVGVAMPSSVVDTYFGYAEENANRLVEDSKHSAKRKGVSVRGLVAKTKTSVVETITDTAIDESADLIVIGTRGLGGFRKLLLGSVSSGVVQHARCNILVIR